MSNELCKCGKVGAISCPKDDRCGIVNKMQERIKADAEVYATGVGDVYRKYASLYGYIAGATEEHERQKPVIDAAEKVAKIFAHDDGNCAICQLAIALEKWKGEVEEIEEIEYMPIHPDDARKPECPKQFPMHLLDEGQAMRNHSQTLKRLKERGGLSVREILAIVGKKPWSHYGSLPWDEAIEMLFGIVITNQQKSK